MGKINLRNPHNQENLSSVASLGVLICLVVTIVGIKLWWFKHRLSFERTSTENSATGGSLPAVIVPRRSKQQKYKKDNKRHSQQIYESVEVHGVFRQRGEDDLEIKPAQQLPPVRIRQISDSSTSLLRLPPSRTKSRDQVHSTAFEDLEIATAPLTTASSSDLTALPEINTKITLTFEEFEKQFKLKELKPETPEPAGTLNNEVIDLPVPPLRLNRSSSAMIKPEKTPRFLKSSQSITMPEFQKVERKRPTGFSRPTEDLTKIDDYDEPKLFETFGERRPTGYIKYEEVDDDLQEQYEQELNAWADKEDYQFTDRCVYKSQQVLPAFNTLRIEGVIYNNDDLNKCPDSNAEYRGFDSINYATECKELEPINLQEPDKIFATKYESVKGPKPTQYLKENINTELKAATERRSSEYVKDFSNAEKYINNEYCSAKEGTPIEFGQEHQAIGKELLNEKSSYKESQAMKAEIAEKFHSEKKHIKNSLDTEENLAEHPSVKENEPKTTVIRTITNNRNFEIFDSSSLQEDFDEQFSSSWPQFEEKIETPKINVRRFNNQDLETQSSFKETDDDNFKETINESNQRSATGYQRDWPESPELKDLEEWQEAFNRKFYNQVRSFMTSETITRSTGFVRENEYSVTFTDDSDEDIKTSLPSKPSNSTANVLSNEKLNSDFSTLEDNESESFTPNKRRPTGFVNQLDSQEDSKNISKTQVKFDQTTDFKEQQEYWNSDIKQRRPTGYIKNLEKLDLTDEETDDQNSLKQQNSTSRQEDNLNDLESKEISHNSPTVRFTELELNFDDCKNNSESLIKQRRPAGFVRREVLDKLEKQVNFQLSNEASEISSQENEALKQRRPTGFLRNEEVTKQVYFHVNQNSDEDEKTEFGNELLKQRRPTGFVRKKELKCLDQPAPIYHPSNNDDSTKDLDEHLWQEMEKDLKQDFSQNFEEEFAKIRHSYEVNEADFLELRDDLQKSATNNTEQPLLVLGKSIDKDRIKPLHSPQEIKITFSEAELAATTSILKDHKLEEEAEESKLRKSKVTFDFKADERIIPARKSHNYSEDSSDYDDVFVKSPPAPIAPQPMQRLSKINYNNETTLRPMLSSVPVSITSFGSQISQDYNDVEDSWSAIRKHRNLTEEFQNLSTDSSKHAKPLLAVNAPTKTSYRNPMAQLAIERAKEVRADMDGFKSRSINDKKTDRSRRQNRRGLTFSEGDYESTEA